MREGLRRWIACLLLAVLVLLYFCSAAYASMDLQARFSSKSDIEHEGKTWRLRKRITTILFAGTDVTGKTENSSVNAYRNGGQADFLLLVVVDDNRDTIQPIQINRDAMTEITVLGVLGNVTGTRTAQICLAHSFGDGGEMSCELLSSAVEGYMLNVPVDHYIVMSLDGIAVFNDALGGIEVTLEDDLTAWDPALAQGKTVTLMGEQAEYFVRQRYYIGEQTNISRMNRQKTYMKAAIEKLTKLTQQDKDYVFDLVDTIEPYLTTDLSSGRMINLLNEARDYEMLPIITPAGETVLGDDGFVQFHTDEEDLLRLVLDAFYEPAKK